MGEGFGKRAGGFSPPYCSGCPIGPVVGDGISSPPSVLLIPIDSLIADSVPHPFEPLRGSKGWGTRRRDGAPVEGMGHPSKG